MGGARSEADLMRVAAIDIGTNTALLLIADIDEQGAIQPVAHEQRLPRLGKDVDHRKVISVSAFDRIGWILNEYKNTAKQYKADRIIAVGTSAVRDAGNREEFLSYLHSSTGLHVEVLAGGDEALWTYEGAITAFPGLQEEPVVIDIGGGSTEISLRNPNSRNGDRQLHRYSLQLGSVRLTERFLKHSPPVPAEIESARRMMLEEFSQVRNPGFQHYRLIGVAGTVTTLACLDQQLQEFDIEKVSGYTMTQENVARWAMKLSMMDTASIHDLSSTTEGRADILAAGALILHEFMSHFSCRTVTASERGLRYGLVLREWKREHL